MTKEAARSSHLPAYVGEFGLQAAHLLRIMSKENRKSPVLQIYVPLIAELTR